MDDLALNIAIAAVIIAIFCCIRAYFMSRSRGRPVGEYRKRRGGGSMGGDGSGYSGVQLGGDSDGGDAGGGDGGGGD